MFQSGLHPSHFHLSHQVDREERPDVDRLYMTFLQATTGGGGWPMSICESKLCIYARIASPETSHIGLTPDLHPFFAGVCPRCLSEPLYQSSDPVWQTYFPPGNFRQVLMKLAEMYVSRR